METHQTQRITTNKEHRNKTSPIAGLLIFGGALAVTGLIAVASFVANRGKAKAPPHEPQRSEPDQPSQDSSSSHDHACYETSDTTKNQVLSCESLPSKTSIVEDKPDLKVEAYAEEESATSLHQEIVLSDDSPPESTVSFNDNGTGEEGMESSADSPSIEEVDQSENQKPLKSVEINEGLPDSDSATTETEEIEDDVVEEDDGVGSEGSENSSEATGRTSLNFSEAAIWPAEVIEEEPQQVKGQIVNEQSEAEGTAELNISRTDDKSHSGANVSEFSGYAGNDRVMASAKASLSEKPNLYAVLNNHLTISKFKTWTILLLLLATLLLVLLTHRNGNSVISS